MSSVGEGVDHAKEQMDWILGTMLRGEDLSDTALRSRFTADFLTMVPEAGLRLMALGLAEEFADSAVQERTSADDAHTAKVQCATGARYKVHVVIEALAPHAISGMWVVPVEVSAAAEVVLLNGTSSSGKTSLARALQAQLPGPWLHVAVDDFQRMASNLQHGLRIVHGFHGSVGALAKAGNRLIVDHLLQEAAWAEALADALNATPVLVVGLTCPIEVLEARERQRDDRQAGIARLQIAQVHGHVDYDIDLDTSKVSVDAAASIMCE